jgi:hypothetical protein
MIFLSSSHPGNHLTYPTHFGYLLDNKNENSGSDSGSDGLAGRMPSDQAKYPTPHQTRVFMKNIKILARWVGSVGCFGNRAEKAK